jgi:transcription initiation factor TFIID subunit 2
MKAVTEALIPAGDVFHFGFSSADEEIKSAALAELKRLLRMDRWIPSFQQTITQAVLTAKEHLHAKGLDNLPLADLLLYTREGVFDDLRAQAFDTLLRVGGLRRDPAVRYIFFTLANDPSPFMRWRVLRGLCEGLGRMALTGNVPALKVGGDEMVVEEDAAETTAVRKDLMERASIAGAIQALRKELAENQTLKEEMWKCAKYLLPVDAEADDSSTTLDFSIRQQVLDLCRILYEEKTSYMVVLRLPKQRKRLVCHSLGKVALLYYSREIGIDGRVKLLCDMSFRAMFLQNGLGQRLSFLL